MSELLNTMIRCDEKPENFIIEKEKLFNLINSWGQSFFYYDNNKNRIKCDAEEKREKLFEYIKQDSVAVYQCTFPAWYYIGKVDDWRKVCITVVENNEDIYWIADPTLPEPIEYKDNF